MEGHKNPVKHGVVGFVIGLGASAAVGLGIGGIGDMGDIGALRDARQDLAADNGQFEESSRNLSRLEQGMGDTCMKVVKVYLKGGQLEGAPEDSIVDDLMGAENKPCGTTPTQVRIGLREVASVQGEIMNAQTNRDASSKKLLQREKNVNHSASRKGLLIGSIAGLGVGAVVAGFEVAGARIYNRRYSHRITSSGYYDR